MSSGPCTITMHTAVAAAQSSMVARAPSTAPTPSMWSGRSERARMARCGQGGGLEQEEGSRDDRDEEGFEEYIQPGAGRRRAGAGVGRDGRWRRELLQEQCFKRLTSQAGSARQTRQYGKDALGWRRACWCTSAGRLGSCGGCVTFVVQTHMRGAGCILACVGEEMPG